MDTLKLLPSLFVEEQGKTLIDYMARLKAGEDIQSN
jgi:hypothetical protein